MTITKKTKTAALTAADRETMNKSLEQKITAFSELKARADDIKDSTSKLQSEILALMDELGPDSVVVVNDDEKLQVTKVVSSTTVVNEDQLKKLFGAKVWNKITTRKMDKSKLDVAIKEGEVSPVDLAAASGVSQYELLTGLGQRFDRHWS